MSYSLDLFSPETYDILTWSDRRGSGFRLRHRGMAGRVQLGDELVCSMTNLSRWVGILEVIDGLCLCRRLQPIGKSRIVRTPVLIEVGHAQRPAHVRQAALPALPATLAA